MLGVGNWETLIFIIILCSDVDIAVHCSFDRRVATHNIILYWRKVGRNQFQGHNIIDSGEGESIHVVIPLRGGLSVLVVVRSISGSMTITRSTSVLV